jgi:ankyrin repeat protein
MSALRQIILKSILLAAILFSSQTGYIFSQSVYPLVQPPSQQGTVIDTSDYFTFLTTWGISNNLMIAASKGYTDEIKRLIDKGADINAETPEGATALIFAVSNNQTASVLTLLEYNPILDKVTRSFETPLLIAAKNGYFEITEALIRAGADLEFTDNFGASPLHYAAVYGYLDIVDLFLYYDAPADVQSDEGTTPLLAAIWAGNTEVADLLIQNGVNIEEADYDGFTPFLLSAFYGDTIIMDVLYKKGANIYATNKAKHNALSIAISTGDTITAKFLLEKGNKWNSKEVEGWDPYVVASKYRRTGMVKILKQYNVPGDLKYGIDQMSFSLSTRFSLHDIYTGFSMSFKEPILNGGLTFGTDVKFWYSRLLMMESENSYYQYMDKSYLVYAGLFKDFNLTENINKYNYAITASLYAGYTFGNPYKGTIIPAESKFKVIPAVGLKMTKQNLTFIGGVEYIKTEFYKNGPVWVRLGITYNYFFDNVRIKVKPLKWF